GPPTSADSVEATDPLQEGARRAEAARAPWTDRLPALRGPLAEPVAAPQVVEVPEQTTVDQVVIQFAADATDEQRDEYIASIGGQVSEQIDALNTVIVEVPAINIDQPLPENPIVEQSEPDYFITALEADTISVPSSDPRYAEQWSLEVIGAPEAWSELPADAATVVIAIIDSGICADHPDLQGRILDGWDYIDNDAVPQDEMGHGCGVAGIIAASIDNGEGIAGIAPNARLLPLRVLDANGLGRYSDVAAAVVRATDAGAAIINLSVGGPYPSSILEEAVNYASAHGVMVIAAAGNNGADSVYYPAAYSSVIAVGAVNADLQPTGFSNHGAEIDVWAPGQDILTTRRDGAYGIASGTSYAAPQVAAVAALEMAFGKQLTLGGIVSTSAKAAQAGAGAGAATITPTAIASATIQPSPTASPEPLQLFAPSTSAQASATSASNQLGVVRTRNVDINFAALPDNFNAPAAQQAERDTVLFNLFDDVTLTADNIRLQPRITSSDGFTWIGQIEGDPYSEVVLVVGDGTIEGHVRTQSTLYQITSLGNGVHAVNQIDESAFRMGADDARPANITNPSAPIEASAADTAGFVDILVVFTPAARNAEGGLTEMLSAIEASVVTTNQSYANSGVTQRLRLVHAAEVPYNETGSISADLDNITDELVTSVPDMRDTYNADVVTFITAGFQDGICGIGWLMTEETPDFAPFAYNVIRQPCMPGGITFAHELGHNMGLDHDLNNGGGDGDGVFAYSNGYQDTAGLFHTIMAYSFNGPCGSFCPSLNRWSNPNQTFNGRPLGVAATADERRSLNETADTVANFRENGAEVCYTLTT
ncbi:MAG: S8 family serine peptidase, partial [Burkholderiales bacterium]|nr:S8 family serine peptidase [Anaerolineae bacterium]